MPVFAEITAWGRRLPLEWEEGRSSVVTGKYFRNEFLPRLGLMCGGWKRKCASSGS